jgi:murein hydrolase activator
MTRLRRCLVAVAALLLLAQAPPVTDADLDRIRGEIAKMKEKLQNVHRQARDARQELEAADLELGIQTGELQIATETRQRADRDRMETESQIAQLVARIARQKSQLRTRLVALYRLGGLSYLRIFMALDQRSDPSQAVSMLTFLVNHDSRMIERFEAANRELDSKRAELAVRQQQLAEIEKTVQERRRAVSAAYAQKRRILTALQAQESGSAEQLAELEEKGRRLERLVDVLSKQAAGEVPSSDVRTYRGTLAWPVDGNVIEHFGRQRNAKFSTVTMNNGLKIAATPRAPVRAVFQGTVLFSQWFKGYGNLIILDHGNQIVSLYGNIVAPEVAVGDRVTTGQSIAGVGDSEEAGGGYLYLEIRQENRPEDPQKWLR